MVLPEALGIEEIPQCGKTTTIVILIELTFIKNLLCVKNFLGVTSIDPLKNSLKEILQFFA